MSQKGIIFIVLFFICIACALRMPQFGLYGYIGDYIMGSGSQWWAAPFRKMGFRFSLMLAMVSAIGIVLNWSKISEGHRLLESQEILMLIFLALVYISMLLGESTGAIMLGESDVARYTIHDHPSEKMLKITIFCIMLTQVITDRAKIGGLMWVLVVGALILGFEAWNLPRSALQDGRLEGIGGPDFQDANRFGGFMAGILFVIGAQFMRTGWVGRVICFIAGGFTANAIILARSRGAVLGMVAGMFVSVLFAPKKYRWLIIVGMGLGGAGLLYLSDPQLLERVCTVTADSDERDASAQSRLDIWAGGVKMIADHPLLGVGPGNFYQNIGKYQPLHPLRDAHNTFIRCGGELGGTGLLVYFALLLNATQYHRWCIRMSIDLPKDSQKNITWMSVGFLSCMTTMITYGMTGTLIYTEYLWWMIMVPVCLKRMVQKELDLNHAEKDE